MLGRDEEHVRVGEELQGLERAVEQRRHRESEVELAALDEPQQVLVRRGLGQLELDVRPLGHEAAHDGGEHARADALERADPEPAALALRERRHVRLGGVQARDDRLRVAEQERARLGEGDRPRAAGSLEQALADEPLERLDLLADRGLRVAERRGRAPEGALARDRLEGREMTELDPEPTIRFHDQHEEYSTCPNREAQAC